MIFDFERIKVAIKTALEERPTGDDWLDSRYNEQIHWVHHTQPYYKLFYYLAQEFQPRVVVELGGWQGTAAAHFAAGAPVATVITIDHHSDPGDDINQARMLEAAGQYSNIKYLQGWTTPGYEEKYHKGTHSVFEEVKQILGERKIDILFIDAWHRGEYFKRDWDYYSSLLADPALVICDDVYNADHFVNMIETFESLPGEKFLDNAVHKGAPMGFIKYGLSADRPTGGTKPKATVKRKPRTTKTTRKRTA